MNIVRFNILILILSSMTIMSCEENLYISHAGEELLVLNSVMQVDSPIVVNLSKTRFILDATDTVDWVRNADVYLTYGDNNFQELLTYEGEGDYVSDQIASSGEFYSIEIVHAKYQNVSATAYMPERTVGTVEYLGGLDGDYNFEIEIKDQKNDDYYIWEMLYLDESENKNVRIVSTDSKTDNILPDASQKSERIFLQGRPNDIVELNSSFKAEDLREKDINNTTVRLVTVNDEMFKYYKSIELYKNSIDNFIEPIEIYSNVNNGLGIFGAYTETYLEVIQ